MKYAPRKKCWAEGVLRWCQTVEGKEEGHEPENRVCNLDREFGSCEEQWEQTDVACHSQWAEGTEVATIVERDQAERNDDQQNRFLVDVPAEEERGVSAEGGSCHEVRPCRAQEELDECWLEKRLVLLVDIGTDWDILTI